MTQQEIMNYRADFPLLRESKVAYLDNAATSQRPDCVLDAQRKFYETHNANPLRGLYQLGMDATEDYAAARETVRRFLNAKSDSEIIFTRNATESLNLVAYSYGLHRIGPEDEIVVSIAEHHPANRRHPALSGMPAGRQPAYGGVGSENHRQNRSGGCGAGVQCIWPHQSYGHHH